MYSHTTEASYFHWTYYVFRWPWLLEVRQGCFYGILIWCVVFARSEINFVRLGLMAVILAFAGAQFYSWHPARALNAEKAKTLESIIH